MAIVFEVVRDIVRKIVRGVDEGLEALIPFFSDLNTWYKTIVGTIFNERINNLPARFLPRVAKFNGTDDLIDTGIKLTGNSFDFTVVCKKDSGEEVAIAQGSSTNSSTGILWFSDNKVYGIIDGLGDIIYGVTTALTNFDKKKLRLVYDGTEVANADKLKLYIDDVYTAFDSFTGTIPSVIESSATNLQIGVQWVSTAFAKFLLYEFEVDGVLKYYPTGQGSHEYDISGNNNHGTINGSGTHYDFDLNGLTRPNDVGYSIWRKTSNPDIQVQFDVNGAALSLTAGVNIPAGYSHERDVPAGGDKHNIYKSLVDMEYGSILQCDTAGEAYINQNDAYGLVFDGIIKKKNTSTIAIYFISADTSTTNNYNLILDSAEAIRLRKDTSNRFVTANGYINADQDYRYLIWRNETTDEFVTGAVGTFAAYIQGKSKAITNKDYDIPNTNEMELIDPTGGSGTNPTTENSYTTSAYLISEIDANDQISKIEVNGKYISPYDFTVSSGAYSIIDNPKNAIFNRTNATRQTPTSRASLFYDADYPFIYHIDELIDPNTYDTFFTTDYKNRFFGVVKLLGSVPVLLKEFLNYATKKTGSALTKVTNYCGITNIYP